MVTRWSGGGDEASARDYAARFAALAATGADVHGEATLCASLLGPGGRVLDAGCGTGRVAIRLAEQGYFVTGVDIDAAMLAVAAEAAPDLRWVQADLVDLALDEAFDLVLAAGNVVPLTAEGTEAAVVARLAAHVAPGGFLVAGFGLDTAHLPRGAALVDLADYDAWCAAAGLVAVRRLGTWEGEPFVQGGGYAVSIHARPAGQ